jgi:hypothetical protein
MSVDLLHVVPEQTLVVPYGTGFRLSFPLTNKKTQTDVPDAEVRATLTDLAAPTRSTGIQGTLLTRTTDDGLAYGVDFAPTTLQKFGRAYRLTVIAFPGTPQQVTRSWLLDVQRASGE